MMLRTTTVALALLLSACAQHGDAPAHAAASEPWLQTQTNLPDSGPPVDADGLHDAVGSCPGEGCVLSSWQLMKTSTALREQPTRASRALATLPVGEWVRAVDSVNRWRPQRGVVVSDVQGTETASESAALHVGDVVYTIDYEGEGYVTLWRRGDTISWYWPEVADTGGIRMDAVDHAQSAADDAGGGGFWIKVRRDNGQIGWVLGETVECLDGQDPTDACRARNGS